MDWMTRLVDIISEYRHVKAIRRSMLLILPMTVMGSFATLINQFPVPAFQAVMVQWLGCQWTTWGDSIISGTFAMNSLLFVFSCIYFIAEADDIVRKGMVHPLLVAMVAFSSFIAFLQPLSGGEKLVEFFSFLERTVFLWLFLQRWQALSCFYACASGKRCDSPFTVMKRSR